MLDLHSGELVAFVIRALSVVINLVVWALALTYLWFRGRSVVARAAAAGVGLDHRVLAMILRWLSKLRSGERDFTAAYQHDLVQSLDDPRETARFGLAAYLATALGLLVMLTVWTVRVYAELLR